MRAEPPRSLQLRNLLCGDVFIDGAGCTLEDCEATETAAQAFNESVRSVSYRKADGSWTKSLALCLAVALYDTNVVLAILHIVLWF